VLTQANRGSGRDPRPLTILLVEDDDGDARAVQRAFRQRDYVNPIARAVDGIEALEMLRPCDGASQPPAPQILLVDLNMPRMNGLQFVSALRNDPNLSHSVVFVLTTSKRDEDKWAAYDLNVAGFIVKARAGENFSNLVNLLDCYWQTVELP
jgi:CheY-like chemotaxis protein